MSPKKGEDLTASGDLFFFLVIWIGGKAVGVEAATSFTIGLVAAFLIWLLIRTRGDDTQTRA